MKNQKKKGFTLVEMLIVIAIIAILVAIIIPTVTSSTKKAKAATDAANLRSAKATATIKVLDGSTATSFSASDLGVPAKSKLDNKDFSCTVTPPTTGDSGAGEVTVKYGDNGIEYYAEQAGQSDSGTGTGTGGGGGGGGDDQTGGGGDQG